jgi:AcrR family transcriptional regulator
MRVSAQTKIQTRERILDVARKLFSDRGFESATTREVAEAAGIATGTLFNYFPTKEAIVAALASEASGEEFGKTNERISAGESLEEDLFALVAGGLRKLKHLRKYIPALLETTLSPLALENDADSTSFRVNHLQAVASVAARHGYRSLPPTALQLYWTLYTGILVFWSRDASPKQEDTLALIDDSLNMFATWLCAQERNASSSNR